MERFADRPRVAPNRNIQQRSNITGLASQLEKYIFILQQNKNNLWFVQYHFSQTVVKTDLKTDDDDEEDDDYYYYYYDNDNTQGDEYYEDAGEDYYYYDDDNNVSNNENEYYYYDEQYN